MIYQKTVTEHMIDQLNGAEEVLSVLDQHAGQSTPMGQVFLKAYETIKVARDKHARDWNDDLNPGEQKIYRCAHADKPYHTDADGPCDVWGTLEICELHEQLARDKHADDERAAAEYHRAKQRGEDV